MLNWLVIGIPAFVIALSRERATLTARPPFLREVGFFALSTGVLFGLAGLAVLLISGFVHDWDGMNEPGPPAHHAAVDVDRAWE